jgi:hypothetical protein
MYSKMGRDCGPVRSNKDVVPDPGTCTSAIYTYPGTYALSNHEQHWFLSGRPLQGFVDIVTDGEVQIRNSGIVINHEYRLFQRYIKASMELSGRTN